MYRVWNMGTVYKGGPMALQEIFARDFTNGCMAGVLRI